MGRFFTRLVSISLLACLLFFGASGQECMGKEKQKNDSTWTDWNFRISPFFWYIGFQGTIYRPPVPSNYPEPPPKYEIDVGFRDIVSSIKFALMLAGQYKGEHVVAQFNFSSLILESEAITPLELVLQNNIINLNYFGGDLGIGYRAVKKPRFELEPILGLKFIYFKIGLSSTVIGNIDVEGARSRFWVDPVVGTNLLYRPGRKIEFSGYADVGPALLTNVLSYQAMAGINYHFTKTFMITLGYRYYAVEFPTDEAIFNGNFKGWITRLGFQF